MSLEEVELTEKIIGAAIEVHRELGPGFLESIYENAMVIALEKIGLKVSQQLEIPIYYQKQLVGTHRIDLLVEKRIVVELKTVREFKDIHFSIVRSYLKATNLKHGLLMNFAKPMLKMKRVIYESEA
ncbi:MAG: GxxExxY protein [Planctomycetaceae bacterium]|nr:GxxExxY protein [Planctomycetaceae bacterium]